MRETNTMSKQKGTVNFSTPAKKKAFIEALPISGGIMQVACQNASQKLGDNVAWSSVYHWMKNDKKFKEKVDEARKIGDAVTGDLAQSTLIQRTQGMEYEEEVAIKVKTGKYLEEVKIVKVKKYLPPDVNAAYKLATAKLPEEYGKQAIDVTTNGKDLVDNPVDLSGLPVESKIEAAKHLKELRKLGAIK